MKDCGFSYIKIRKYGRKGTREEKRGKSKNNEILRNGEERESNSIIAF